ncbi:hypothetical protein SAMN04487881_0705 [Marinobacter sp. es.048]|nr:hypothetical protein SAMN04487881_0705 [Marinobacter sp. es.048]
MAAQPRVLTGSNPFELDPENDYLAPPKHDVPLWSETMFFMVWSPEQEVGVWLHVGVVPEDKTMWWAQTFVMLPDGVVLVDRSFGRPSDKFGPETGNLSIKCTEPHRRWLLKFDGAGEVSSTSDLAKGLVGAGVASPFQFEIELEAKVPVYDMHAGMGAEIDWDVGSLHQEQGFAAQGTLSALGKEWTIEGAAIRDHSRGERHFARWGGHVWNYTIWPQSQRALCVFTMWSPQTESTATVVMIMENGQTELCSDFVITGMERPGGNPKKLELKIVRTDGSELRLEGQVLHNVTMTYVEPNHNLNGVYIDPREDLDATIADESVVRWTWPDGDVGYGNFERGFRPSILPRTKIPLPATSRYFDDK